MDEVAARYAPLVVLHGDDKLRPSSAEWFVERSRLRWATGVGLDGVPVQGAEDGVDAARLGAAGANPYSHDGHLASALTRPLDDHSARRGVPPLERGFFLPLKEEKHARGAGTAATVYWDYDEQSKAMTYWLFYPGSSPPLGILRAGEQLGMRSRDAAGAPPADGPPEEIEAATAAATLEEFQRAYPGLAAETEVGTRGVLDVVQRLRVVAEGVRALLRDDDVLHEGDWERVTVYLDQADPRGAPPASVAFYRHSTNTFRKWASVEKEGEHPVAYSAIGSHASLPSADFGYIDVGDREGPRWRTWDELASIVEQPWYGFGGAWGRVGKVRDSTGPLGPGAHWRHPAQRPAL
ncbi:MAG TPA: hypothetical protein VHH55_05350 [Gaiellaceae bacterium]|nr:hypothetical protein [Gaiellaceae bacterium]